MTPLLLTAVVAYAWLLPSTEAGMCLPYQRIAHPRNCSRYIFCDEKGSPHGFACPPGLHFNKDKSWCDWPINANCTREDKSLWPKHTPRTRIGVRKDGMKFVQHKSKMDQLNSTAHRAAVIKMKEDTKSSDPRTVMNKAKPKEDQKNEPRMEIKRLGQEVKVATMNGSAVLDSSKTTGIKDKAAAVVKPVKGNQGEKVGGKPHAHFISKREDKVEKKINNEKSIKEKVSIENKTLLNEPSDEGIKTITTLMKNDTFNESQIAENKSESKKEEEVDSKSAITYKKSMDESLDEQEKKAQEQVKVVIKNVTFMDSKYNKKTSDVSNMTSTDFTSYTNIPTYNSMLEALRKMYNITHFEYFPLPVNETELGYGLGDGEASTGNITSEISNITDNPLKNDSENKSISSPKIEIPSAELPVTSGNASSVVKVFLTESAPKIENDTKSEDISKSSPSTTYLPTIK